MITLKTSVLLACSLKMGALIGGATEGNANKLYEFSKNLGIAFQLQDDYLDSFGDTDKVGKQIGGDIRSNKKTFLLLKALENANSDQREKLSNLINRDDKGKFDEMLELFQQTSADKACREAVEKYSQAAYDCLEDVAVLDKRKFALKELAEYLLQRDN